MSQDTAGQNITGTKLYAPSDLAALGSHDCRGCSACCYDMEGLFLDPMDIYMLSKASNRTFQSMLDEEIELDRHYGLILPKMKMDAARKSCHFLDANGRCSIHALRPGICRIFPLGRNYENGELSYFLLHDECKIPNRYKIKISKWIGIEDYKKYHSFLLAWHSFVKETGELLTQLTPESARQVLLYVLKLFFESPYRMVDFYTEFEVRLAKAENAIFHR